MEYLSANLIGFTIGKPIQKVLFSIPAECTGGDFIRRMAPIQLIVYSPNTKEGAEILAKRAADVHAASVHQRLKALNCPADQKLELLNAVIETVRKRFQESSP